jgi:hypothetical protein
VAVRPRASVVRHGRPTQATGGACKAEACCESCPHVDQICPHQICAGSFAFAGGLIAPAQSVTPASYVYNVSPDAGYPDSGGQLTDGILASMQYVGNPPGIAVPWQGWLYVNPDVTFTFAAPTTITQVNIGFERYGLFAVGLPTNVTIAGNTFTVGSSYFADQTRDWITFTGSFVANNTLQISMTPSDQWTLIDEVQFVAIPEPSTCAALAGLGALGLALRRRLVAPKPVGRRRTRP